MWNSFSKRKRVESNPTGTFQTQFVACFVRREIVKNTRTRRKYDLDRVLLVDGGKGYWTWNLGLIKSLECFSGQLVE